MSQSTALRKRGIPVERLSDKERIFCDAYLVNFNATEACRIAGYKSKNCNAIAKKMLEKECVKKYLGKALMDLSDDYKLTRKRILQELAYLALRDVIDLCDENGMIVIDDMRKIPEQLRRCIDGIKCKSFKDKEGNITHQEIEIKLVSKSVALRMAMEHKGLFPTKEVDVTIKTPLDWDSMLGPPQEIDSVEERIMEVEARNTKYVENTKEPD